MSVRRRFWTLAMVGAAGGVVGCSSSKTTMLHRDSTGVCWEQERLHGVPMTLDVPTHLRLTLVKQQYWDGEHKADGFVRNDPNALVTYDIKQDVITQKKIFLVDPKRPAAGGMSFGAALSDGKLNSLNYNVNDTTIETVGKQVNDLVKTVLPVLGRRTSVVVPSGQTSTLQTIESVVATNVFQLDAPDLVDQVRSFLCCATEAVKLPQCSGCPPTGCVTTPLSLSAGEPGTSGRPEPLRHAGLAVVAAPTPRSGPPPAP